MPWPKTYRTRNHLLRCEICGWVFCGHGKSKYCEICRTNKRCVDCGKKVSTATTLRCRQCQGLRRKAERTTKMCECGTVIDQDAIACQKCRERAGRERLKADPERYERVRELAREADKRRRAQPHRRDLAHRMNRQRRLHGEGAGDYERSEIFARDGGTCMYCGLGVDLELAWPDPLSASIEHWVPLSRGGTDEPDNVYLTHLGCNLSKGTSLLPPPPAPLEQARLAIDDAA